jgi:hypothetical protein
MPARRGGLVGKGRSRAACSSIDPQAQFLILPRASDTNFTLGYFIWPFLALVVNMHMMIN